MTPSHLDAYHALLATRRAAARRDMILMGVLSVIAVGVLLTLSLRAPAAPSRPSLWIIAVVALAWIVSQTQAFVRWHVARTTMELIEALQRDRQPS